MKHGARGRKTKAVYIHCSIENEKWEAILGTKAKILIVDDEPFNIEIVQEMFDEEYQIIAAENGEQGVEMATETLPDVILLDVGMPGIDGYEVCRQLKADFVVSDIPVIFVSARDSVEERMQGYGVGAEDYITKPFDTSELKAKVEIALKNREENKALKGQVGEIMGTAMEALTTAGELGVVMRFLDDSIGCKTHEALFKKFFEATQTFGLTCTLQYRAGHEVVNCSETGEAKPIEIQLLDRLKNVGRFYDFGQRTVINFENVSLLVKNMPVDEPLKNGRMRDNLPQLLNGAQARLLSITAENDLARKRAGLEKMLKMTEEVLTEIEQKFEKHKEESEEIINQLIQEMDAGLLTIDVSEVQERYLMHLIETNKQRIMGLFDKGLEIDTHFERLIGALRKELA
jgi:DNA-binding response OmpR family regulator